MIVSRLAGEGGGSQSCFGCRKAGNATDLSPIEQTTKRNNKHHILTLEVREALRSLDLEFAGVEEDEALDGDNGEKKLVFWLFGCFCLRVDSLSFLW